jgi:hypothetical protein
MQRFALQRKTEASVGNSLGAENMEKMQLIITLGDAIDAASRGRSVHKRK